MIETKSNNIDDRHKNNFVRREHGLGGSGPAGGRTRGRRARSGGRGDRCSWGTPSWSQREGDAHCRSAGGPTSAGVLLGGIWGIREEEEEVCEGEGWGSQTLSIAANVQSDQRRPVFRGGGSSAGFFLGGGRRVMVV